MKRKAAAMAQSKDCSVTAAPERIREQLRVGDLAQQQRAGSYLSPRPRVQEYRGAKVIGTRSRRN